MRWAFKAAAFKVLSAVPAGSRVYRFLQDHVTRTTLVTESKVDQRIGFGLDCLRTMRELLDRDASELRVLDVGAGWVPTVPLLFFSVGVQSQLLLDVQPLLRLDRLAQLVQTFRRCAERSASLTEWRRRLPPTVEEADTLDGYLAALGIRYLAPYQAADLADAGRFDVSTCTSVLHHLDERTLRSVLATIHGSLEDGGLLLAHTPLHDPYARFDGSITPYNKWRYSPSAWERFVNSSLMSFNQLTISDYKRLLQESGFEVVRIEESSPTAQDVEALRTVRLHPEFAGRPDGEFLAPDIFLVARRTERAPVEA